MSSISSLRSGDSLLERIQKAERKSGEEKHQRKKGVGSRGSNIRGVYIKTSFDDVMLVSESSYLRRNEAENKQADRVGLGMRLCKLDNDSTFILE